MVKNYFPHAEWLLTYKFFVILAILCLFWIFTKKIILILWTLYVAFYPLILFFWKIPYFVFSRKSWTLAIAFINTIISFFSSLKYNFIIFSASAISFCLLFNVTNSVALYSLIVAFLLLIIIIHVNRFLTIFRPSSMYKIHLKSVNFLISNTERMVVVDEEVKNLPITQMTDIQIQKWTNNLQYIVIFNRGCHFFSSKLQEYQKSNLNIVFYLLNLFILLEFTQKN